MMRFKEEIQQRFTARHKRSLDFAGNLKDKVILDIGCSIGWFEKFAIGKGCLRIVGMDLCENNLSNAVLQVNHERAKFLKGCALDLSACGEDVFDVVVMWEVMEHLPFNAEQKSLKEVARVLKSSGVLFVSVPNKSFWSCALDPAWYLGHRHYSRKCVSTIFSKSGFIIEKVEYGGAFFELFSMFLLYIFKWLLRQELPFKGWFEKKREEEYFNDQGFVNLFLKASKPQLTKT